MGLRSMRFGCARIAGGSRDDVLCAATRRQAVRSGRGAGDGGEGVKYDVILADPPWSFEVWNKDTGQGRRD